MRSLDWIEKELGALRADHLFREPAIIEAVTGTEILISGKRYISACSNNYLGLATDERVVEAGRLAAEMWGAGAGASPLVSGLLGVTRDLERKLATLKSCEDALVFSSGYLANLGAVTALVGRGDAVFSDELNHASIIDACRLSGAEIRVYRHRDAAHLADLVNIGGFRRGLIVTDSVFSMDGDIAPLPEIVEIAENDGLMTMVDEAHATGVLGEKGAGAIEAGGVAGRIDVVMGTLSKALGAAGGFIAGSRDLADFLRNRARSLIFDTAPVPAAVGAAAAALEISINESWRRSRIVELRKQIEGALSGLGYDVGASESAVIPVFLGDSERALRVAAAVREYGVFAPAIRPPSVPEGTSRIRLTVMATLSDSDAEQIVAAFDGARSEAGIAR